MPFPKVASHNVFYDIASCLLVIVMNPCFVLCNESMKEVLLVV